MTYLLSNPSYLTPKGISSFPSLHSHLPFYITGDNKLIDPNTKKEYICMAKKVCDIRLESLVDNVRNYISATPLKTSVFLQDTSMIHEGGKVIKFTFDIKNPENKSCGRGIILNMESISGEISTPVIIIDSKLLGDILSSTPSDIGFLERQTTLNSSLLNGYLYDLFRANILEDNHFDKESFNRDYNISNKSLLFELYDSLAKMEKVQEPDIYFDPVKKDNVRLNNLLYEILAISAVDFNITKKGSNENSIFVALPGRGKLLSDEFQKRLISPIDLDALITNYMLFDRVRSYLLPDCFSIPREFTLKYSGNYIRGLVKPTYPINNSITTNDGLNMRLNIIYLIDSQNGRPLTDYKECYDSLSYKGWSKIYDSVKKWRSKPFYNQFSEIDLSLSDSNIESWTKILIRREDLIKRGRSGRIAGTLKTAERNIIRRHKRVSK